MDSVDDSLVIGEQIKKGRRAGDVRVVLFVKLKEGLELNADIEADIRNTIRDGASDAHVPALIKQVQKIPYTRSGKKVELAVKDLIDGIEPRNMGALQDASAFDEYREMAKEGLWFTGRNPMHMHAVGPSYVAFGDSLQPTLESLATLCAKWTSNKKWYM